MSLLDDLFEWARIQRKAASTIASVSYKMLEMPGAPQYSAYARPGAAEIAHEEEIKDPIGVDGSGCCASSARIEIARQP